MSNRQRDIFDTSNREAVRLLNGLWTDVERLKNDSDLGDGSVRLTRSISEQAEHSATVTTAVDDSPVGIYDSDSYGFTVWGGGETP